MCLILLVILILLVFLILLLLLILLIFFILLLLLTLLTLLILLAILLIPLLPPRYVMRIVPTTYEDIGGSKLVAYQYTYAYRWSRWKILPSLPPNYL